jgi:prepilin-type N-terminal cleavage/methylation domain-containing protein
MMKYFAPQRGGFTLIEIMIVIGIMALVLVMGMPSILQTMQKDPLRKAVSDLVDRCEQARAGAILDGVPTELAIRAADGQMTVRRVSTNSVGQAASAGEIASPAAAGAPSAAAGFSSQLHQDIAVTLLYVNLKDQMGAEESRVRFYPNGTSDEFTIVLESNLGIRKISLDCVTAIADVQIVR